MREACVLFAGRFNEEEEPIFVVPVAYIILHSETVRFFEKVRNGYEAFVDFVVRSVKACCPCVLVPFEGDGWRFYVNSEAVAVLRGYKIDYLPVVDLTSRC
jgi:hypothetical protein